MADNIKIDLTGVPMVLNNLDLAKIVGAKKLGNRAASDQEAVGMLKTSCSFLQLTRHDETMEPIFEAKR